MSQSGLKMSTGKIKAPLSKVIKLSMTFLLTSRFLTSELGEINAGNKSDRTNSIEGYRFTATK
ncbi:hypothetical protein THIOSC15_1420008 [uncultured Thiomicrorhabdus sp.]